MSAAEMEMPSPTTVRLLAAPSPDHPTHLKTYGALPVLTGAQLLAEVHRAGLTGRGGAGFPTAVKLRAVAAGSGRAVVVANGAEGEPGSGKDRHLLLGAPHLVLDGLQIAAQITGASEAFVYLRADTVTAVRRALSERARSRVDRTPVTVVEAAAGFVAGQETAVVSRLNSGPALPRFAPVRVTERGVHGRPTLVQNVETLGHLALIARYGAAWFRELGDAAQPGTFLATVHDPAAGYGPAAVHGRATGADRPIGMDGRSQVWEVPHGITLNQLLDATGGRPPDWQAVLVGGYHGTWLPLPAAGEVPLSKAGLAPYGGGLGAGVLIPLPSSRCGLAETAGIVGYLAAESAKQCGPCTFGLPHLAGLMSALAGDRIGIGRAGVAQAEKGQSIVQQIRTAVGLVEGRGSCQHPDATARLVRSAMLCFDADVRLHEHGRCLARIAEPYGDSR